MSAQVIGALATRALMREIDTWPKPGLVTPVDSGSHTDMDARLLRRSAYVLRPYFIELAQAGAQHAPLAVLRQIGCQAEQTMLGATGGINTHRGAIFGMGLLCAAAGLMDAESLTYLRRARPSLGQVVRRQWGAALGAQPRVGGNSHGAMVQRRHGVGGAHAEAACGFETLYQVALPALRRGRRLAPVDANAARVQCCMALMAHVEDTNLLFRGGAEGLLFARSLAQTFIDRGGIGARDWQQEALRAHHALVERRLSPGGCADLLAMALFVDGWVRWRRASRSMHTSARLARETVGA